MAKELVSGPAAQYSQLAPRISFHGKDSVPLLKGTGSISQAEGTLSGAVAADFQQDGFCLTAQWPIGRQKKGVRGMRSRGRGPPSIRASEGAPLAEAAQEWRAEEYRRDCAFVAQLGQPVLDLLAPTPGESVLDLGCGDGALTKRVVASGCTVTAVDSSEDMIRVASGEGLKAFVMDGQKLIYAGEFDAVFTNAALHWMKQDPPAVIAGVRRALKPGGRFVGEFGGFGNVAAVRTATLAVLKARGIDGSQRDPWFFPTADAYRAMLESHGFQVEVAHLIPRPTFLPAGMSNWLSSFGDSFFKGMNTEQRAGVQAEIVHLLSHTLCDAGGNWYADYVRLRFKAVLA